MIVKVFNWDKDLQNNFNNKIRYVLPGMIIVTTIKSVIELRAAIIYLMTSEGNYFLLTQSLLTFFFIWLIYGMFIQRNEIKDTTKRLNAFMDNYHQKGKLERFTYAFASNYNNKRYIVFSFMKWFHIRLHVLISIEVFDKYKDILLRPSKLTVHEMRGYETSELTKPLSPDSVDELKFLFKLKEKQNNHFIKALAKYPLIEEK